MTRVEAVAALAARVQKLPYRWPSPPTAAAARAQQCGSCAAKHALLAEELAAVGVASRPIFCVGPLVPSILSGHRDVAEGLDLVEVHELLTVDMPGIGPVRVDVTWDPPLVRAGLPGTLGWDGRSDMTIAVDPTGGFHAPDPASVREAKEALRRRLYSLEQRARRDRVLAAMSRHFDQLRASAR